MTPLILASASPVRAKILRQAGVPFVVQPSAVEEEAIKTGHRDPASDGLALALAEAKALAVTAPGHLVLGCDQILVCEGRRLDKALSLDEAGQTLKFLRGRTHQLKSALVLAKDRAVVWQACETASLTMRDFSDDFLGAYLEAAGSDILGAVGCYYFEEQGSQLFERVEGDFFCILGLPLLPLLAALRQVGGLAS